MNKALLTVENAFNGGRYNKLPNPQAEISPFKIKYLQKPKSRRPAAFSPLEKIIYVHKCEA
ncbi:hypothetical protein FHW83_005673 [Duganella sp. SG902]|uniref:hypothetical protein n=1 Tax=Duganella sp. SG902 TaxID=2587016 RepID=UPI00159E8B87|nr:hypothetical protein [Duganella sp. SG902]NVM79831.1 hypothetical protein [Duganella sp. SG902]